MATTDFTTGAEFISFELSPSPSPPSTSRLAPSLPPIQPALVSSSSSKKQKGKGREEAVVNGNGNGAAANGKGKRKRDKEKNVSGGASTGTHGIIHTGPKNLKEERKAKERGSPWVDDVDWEGCGDPAEM